jgi:hypothetical protein
MIYYLFTYLSVLDLNSGLCVCWQVLYRLIHTSTLFDMVIMEIGSHCLAWAKVLSFTLLL